MSEKLETKAVFIGGFMNGRTIINGVLDVLGEYYEDVEGFTFSQANDMDRHSFQSRANNTDIYTHSAGILAVRSVQFSELTAFNPPVPTSRTRLLGKTLRKTLDMAINRDGYRIGRVAKYNASAITEMLAHPGKNLSPFVSGDISNYNYDHSLGHLAENGSLVTVVNTDRDLYFPSEIDPAAETKYATLMLPGNHDAVVLNPENTLANYVEGTVILRKIEALA